MMDESFHSGKFYYSLKYGNGTVSWTNVSNDADAISLRLKDEVVAVTSINSHDPKEQYPHSFEIHYVVKEGPRYKYKKKRFSKLNSEIVNRWYIKMKEDINNIVGRPRCIMLFVNPNSGSKNAIKIYQKTVKPYFDLANVNTFLIVTKRPRFIQDMIIENGWPPSIEGIVAFGGDGTLCELINGVMIRSAMEAGVNLDSENVSLDSPGIRLGVIPAGSTDTVTYSMHRTSDIDTAVFHIILGNKASVDVGFIHSKSKFLSCCTSVMSYGFLAEVIQSSEGLRYLGPTRYEVAGFINLLKTKTYRGRFVFNKESDSSNGDRVLLRNRAAGPNFDTLAIDDRYFMVSIANVSCSSTQSPNGLAPHCKPNDGYFNVIIVNQLSYCEKIKFFLTLASKSSNIINDLPYVTTYKTDKVTFEFAEPHDNENSSNSRKCVWNCDGELIKSNYISVRCHSNMLKMFGVQSADDK